MVKFMAWMVAGELAIEHVCWEEAPVPLASSILGYRYKVMFPYPWGTSLGGWTLAGQTPAYRRSAVPASCRGGRAPPSHYAIVYGQLTPQTLTTTHDNTTYTPIL